MSEKQIEKQIDVDEEIKRVQLETAQLGLVEAKERNARTIAEREERARRNKNRQAEIESTRAGHRAIENNCRHRQGGGPGQEYRGKGEPCVFGHKMPLGELRFQCNRCLAEVMEPNELDEKRRDYRDAQGRTWREQKALFDKFRELAEENGMEMTAGPQFIATKDGIPFRPSLV